jgi:ABC-type iron transport system FetAB permease component
MNLIATVKSKAQTLLCVILATLLTVSYLSHRGDDKELTALTEKLTEHVQLNNRLSEQNLALASELKTKPIEFITITKEVDKEVCNGIVKQNLINAIPSKKGSINEETTADIDDKLPTDLLKLLK